MSVCSSDPFALLPSTTLNILSLEALGLFLRSVQGAILNYLFFPSDLQWMCLYSQVMHAASSFDASLNQLRTPD